MRKTAENCGNVHAVFHVGETCWQELMESYWNGSVCFFSSGISSCWKSLPCISELFIRRCFKALLRALSRPILTILRGNTSSVPSSTASTF